MRWRDPWKQYLAVSGRSAIRLPRGIRPRLAGPVHHPGRGVLPCYRKTAMPSVADDFEFIARRANEIRAARCQDLGVSTPDAQDPPRPVGRPDGAPGHPGLPPVAP